MARSRRQPVASRQQSESTSRSKCSGRGKSGGRGHRASIQPVALSLRSPCFKLNRKKCPVGRRCLGGLRQQVRGRRCGPISRAPAMFPSLEDVRPRRRRPCVRRIVGRDRLRGHVRARLGGAQSEGRVRRFRGGHGTLQTSKLSQWRQIQARPGRARHQAILTLMRSTLPVWSVIMIAMGHLTRTFGSAKTLQRLLFDSQSRLTFGLRSGDKRTPSRAAQSRFRRQPVASYARTSQCESWMASRSVALETSQCVVDMGNPLRARFRKPFLCDIQNRHAH